MSTTSQTIHTVAKRAIMAGLLIASLLIGALSVAPVSSAKGTEGGVVCTGTELTGDTCQPRALQATPIGSMPLGCQPSSGDTVACGRRGSHLAPAPQSAGSAVNGAAQALAQHSGVTAGTQPQPSRHAAR